MANVLIVKDDSYMSLKAFIAGLCGGSADSGNGQGINIVSCWQSAMPYHVIVLNGETSPEILHAALKSIVSGGTIILNSDERNMKSLRLLKPVRLITYGFNPKSTVTASSVDEKEVMTVQCCIQRAFPTLDERILEPQEFTLVSHENMLSVHDVLAAASVAATCGRLSLDYSEK